MGHFTSLLKVARPIYSSFQRGTKLMFSKQYLLYTNIGISMGISAGGDVIQQYIQHRKGGSLSKIPWDVPRICKMAATGLVIAPFIHYWYQCLDVWCPGRCWRMLLKKVTMDLIISSPVCVFLFISTTAVLDSQNLNLVQEEFKKTGTAMFVIDTVVWTPAQAFNFYFLPTRYRILFDNSVSLAVDTYFSHLRFGEHSSYQLKHSIEEQVDPQPANDIEKPQTFVIDQ